MKKYYLLCIICLLYACKKTASVAPNPQPPPPDKPIATLYVASNTIDTGAIYAIDISTGKLKQEYTPEKFAARYDSSDLPCINAYKSAVYILFNKQNRMYAIDANTGKPKQGFVPPMLRLSGYQKLSFILNDLIYVMDGGAGIDVVDPNTGEYKWHIDIPYQTGEISLPYIFNNIVYFRTGTLFGGPLSGMGNRIYAFDTKIHDFKTGYTANLPDDFNPPYCEPISLLNGQIYSFGLTKITKINPDNGASTNISGQLQLMVAGDDAYMYGINVAYKDTLVAFTGTELATPKPLFKPYSFAKDHYIQGLTIHTGILFALDNQGDLYAINSSSGNLNWKTDLGSGMQKTTEFHPLFYNNTLYFALKDKVYAIDITSGNIQWQYTVKGNILANTCCIITPEGKVISLWDYRIKP